MEEQQKLKNDKIEEMIYEVRGQLVMLDSDLAKLYGYKGGTKVINQTIKRNIILFSDNNYFQLTKEEIFICSKSQIVTLNVNNKRGSNIKKLPYVLTSEGIKILSTILRKRKVSIVTTEIILAFENIKNKNDKRLVIPLNKGNRIENMIYEIRGKQIMLDSDLALLYECSNGTKTINQAVKRHLERFPDDFYFQLTEDECITLSKSQVGTLNEIKRGMNIKKLPYVFTEQGVAMLATILRTPIAEKVSVNIMRAFVSMRKYISTNLIEQKYINELVLKDNKRIDLLEETFSRFEEKEKINEIYFDGQIYDAFSKILDIMNQAKKELIIIDGYADKTVLDLISKLQTKAILITKEKANLSKLLIDKYNSQYNNLTLIYNNSFHDRYFIIDRKTIYHCGASINHAGSKTFSINKLEDEIVISSIIDKILSITKV